MPKIKGPAIFLAQFMRDEAPYNTMENIGKWVAGLGYTGVQIPNWDDRVIDIGKAAESKTYCDDFKGTLNEMGLEATEVAGYLAGQVLAVHPAYEVMFEAFHPPGLRGDERTAWATEELTKCIHASVNMGLDVIPVLSGGFAWHTIYPWPQRPDGIIEEAFKELAARWLPLLDLAHDKGQVFAYELHPGSDIYDGATYEMFLDYTDDHPAACLNYDPSHFLLQQLDYIDFIRLYSERIKGFHVKDAEFRRQVGLGSTVVINHGLDVLADSVHSVTDKWISHRCSPSLPKRVMRVGQYWNGNAVSKVPEQGAAEGAPFIAKHIIETTDVAFDDFAGGETDTARNRDILGLI